METAMGGATVAINFGAQRGKLTAQKLVANKRTGSGQLRSVPWQARPAAPAPRKLASVRKVAFLGDCDDAVRKATAFGVAAQRQLQVQAERFRKCLHADAVVVDSLDRLEVPTAGCSEQDDVVHMAYIFGLGRPVILAASWEVADGDPEKVPAAEIIRFASAAKLSKAQVCFSAGFVASYRALTNAINTCTQATGSLWRIVEASEADVIYAKVGT